LPEILRGVRREVIKVEPPEAILMRKWRKHAPGTSLWWYVQNRNKKSVTVNCGPPKAGSCAGWRRMPM